MIDSYQVLVVSYNSDDGTFFVVCFLDVSVPTLQIVVLRLLGTKILSSPTLSRPVIKTATDEYSGGA